MQKVELIISLIKKECKKYQNPIVTELGGLTKDPFKVLISCLLSLRTKDAVTSKASKSLFEIADTPTKILKLDIKKIEKLIYPVGFYRTKAKRIKEICKVLIKKYNGKVPKDFDELKKLRGVGSKTAAITMVYGHKSKDFIPVDIHVHIIANRLGWIKTKTPEQTMKELMKVLPKKHWYTINNLFVTFGQKVCITNSPKCSNCPVREYCPKINVKRSR